jgi:H+/Cl- antiporter ClcA
MDGIGCASGFWRFFYFWGFNYFALGPLLPHLLWDNHKFLHYLHKENPVESEGMVFQEIAWGILLGLIFGAFMVQNVLSRPETEKFTGPYLAWLIFWRGLIYGAIDGLLLSVFPWIVTWRASMLKRNHWERK